MYKYEKILRLMPKNKWFLPSEIKKIARENGIENPQICIQSSGFRRYIERKRLGGKTYMYKRVQ